MLRLSTREWVVLLLALLLASSIWLIHKLSLEYSVYMNVKVVAESNIHGHSKYSSSGVEVMAKCRTTGWRVLYSYLTRDKVVYVNIPSNVLESDPEDKNSYYITSERLHEYADQIYGSGVSVDYFVSEKVSFKFNEETWKEVPIKPVSTLSFEEQHLAVSELIVEPDHVIVYGDPVQLSQLEFVTTDIIKHTSIVEDISGMISLTPISGLRYSVDEVHYMMDISRYVEIEHERIPIEVINTPPGKRMVADPLYVDVVLKCQFPLKSDVTKAPYLIVDYEEFRNSISGKVVVELQTMPAGVIDYEISPFFVTISEAY